MEHHSSSREMSQRCHRIINQIDLALEKVRVTQKNILADRMAQVTTSSMRMTSRGAVGPSSLKGGGEHQVWGGGDRASIKTFTKGSPAKLNTVPFSQLDEQNPVSEKVSEMLRNVAMTVAKTRKMKRYNYSNMMRKPAQRDFVWSVKKISLKGDDEIREERLYKINYFGTESFKSFPVRKEDKLLEQSSIYRDTSPETNIPEEKYTEVKSSKTLKKVNHVPQATKQRANIRAKATLEKQDWEEFLEEPKRVESKNLSCLKRDPPKRTRAGSGDGPDVVESDPFKSVSCSQASTTHESDTNMKHYAQRLCRKYDRRIPPMKTSYRIPKGTQKYHETAERKEYMSMGDGNFPAKYGRLPPILKKPPFI